VPDGVAEEVRDHLLEARPIPVAREIAGGVEGDLPLGVDRLRLVDHAVADLRQVALGGLHGMPPPRWPRVKSRTSLIMSLMRFAARRMRADDFLCRSGRSSSGGGAGRCWRWR
jgi:hypothetical protein